jgi:hypothetical protein
MDLIWSDLFASGSIVDVHVSQWSGRVQIRPSDFGLNSDAVEAALSLGHHRLVPRESFNAIGEVVANTKKTIDQHGISFPFIRGARFVPEKSLVTLLDRLKVQKELFDKATDVFIASYEQTVAAMRPVIWQALNDAARDPEIARVAMSRIDQEYPSSSNMKSKFSLKWSVYAIQSPSSDVPIDTDIVKDVLRGMVTDLRGEVSEKLGEVLKVISRGGTLQKRSVDSARAVLDRVESVSIFGDKTLTNQIKEIRKILDNINAKKVSQEEVLSIEQIKGILETDIDAAVEAAEKSLTGLGQRKIQVPDAV